VYESESSKVWEDESIVTGGVWGGK
jgi:hypothetical protein